MPPVVRWCLALALCALAWLLLGLPALGMALGVRAPPALPPPREQDASTLPDGTMAVGACRRQRVGQLIYVHLEGDPVASGYAQGLLVGDRVARIETDMMGMFVERVPSFWARHLILGMVNFNNRTLADYFLPSELDEIAAITSGHHRAHDCYLGVSPSYARGMQYHALHDISQYLIDNPLVHPPQVGCTAIALAGARTAGGHLLVGRLFDFEGGTCFDTDKVVYTVAPDHGHRFVSVSWGGMAGAVTGLNDARLWVSINAAATDGHPPGHGLVDRYVGRPIVMVVRRMLQDCATIDEAVAVAQAADVFVSDGILVGSGVENRAVVIEKGPLRCAVRAMDQDSLVLTNHFLAPEWAGDRANAARIRAGTTAVRFRRAEELIAAKPVHDVASILAMLRDHRGLGGLEVGFGNRSTINAWIGAHLVVADATQGVIWVCEPWHGLGVAHAFDVDGPRPDLADLPADPQLDFVATKLDAYRATEERAKRLIDSGQAREAAPLTAQLLAENPSNFAAQALDALTSDDLPHRLDRLRRACALQPAYLADRDGLQRAISAATSRLGPPRDASPQPAR